MKSRKNNDTDYGISMREASSAKPNEILSPRMANNTPSLPEIIHDSIEVPKLEVQSDYTVLKRIQWVMEQYLLGRYPYQIREEYKELFKLSDYSYDHDVEWANKQLQKRGEMELEAVITRHTDLYYDIYRASRGLNDNKAALSALKHIEDLLKIHSPKSSGSITTNIQVNNHNTKLPDMTIEELKDLLGKK